MTELVDLILSGGSRNQGLCLHSEDLVLAITAFRHGDSKSNVSAVVFEKLQQN